MNTVMCGEGTAHASKAATRSVFLTLCFDLTGAEATAQHPSPQGMAPGYMSNGWHFWHVPNKILQKIAYLLRHACPSVRPPAGSKCPSTDCRLLRR